MSVLLSRIIALNHMHLMWLNNILLRCTYHTNTKWDGSILAILWCLCILGSSTISFLFVSLSSLCVLLFSYLTMHSTMICALILKYASVWVHSDLLYCCHRFSRLLLSIIRSSSRWCENVRILYGWWLSIVRVQRQYEETGMIDWKVDRERKKRKRYVRSI